MTRLDRICAADPRVLHALQIVTNAGQHTPRVTRLAWFVLKAAMGQPVRQATVDRDAR